MKVKNLKSNDTVTHIIKPNGEEPPEVTYCGRQVRTLVRCGVYSVEAASCNGCIKQEQALVHGRKS